MKKQYSPPHYATPKRNPNALPQLLIHSSDEEEDDVEVESLDASSISFSEKTTAYTPVMEEIKIPGGKTVIKKNQVFPTLLHRDYYGKITTHSVIPNKTKYCCWWCCHPFETTPFFLPHYYCARKQIYYVYGNICSANCGKSYILHNHSAILSRILSWFSMLCKKVYKIPISERIRPAGPRESLKMFGGPFTIEEFREKFTTSIIKLIDPPFFVMVQELHEAIYEEKKLRQDIRKKHDERDKIVSENQTPVVPFPPRQEPETSILPAKRKMGQPMRPGKREKKGPNKQPVLKLLRGAPLPGSKSTLARFMKKND